MELVETNANGNARDEKEEDPMVKARRLLHERLGDAVATLQRGVKEKDVTLVARSLRKCTEIRRMFTSPETRSFLESPLLPTSPRARSAATWASMLPSSSATTTTTKGNEKQPLPQLSLDALIEEISSIPGLSKDPRAKEAILKPLLAATHAAAAASSSSAGTSEDAMAIESPVEGTSGKIVVHVLPEVELFLHILTHRVALESLRRGHSAGSLVESARVMVARAKQYDRRTMDQLTAKAWGVVSLTAERAGEAGLWGGDLLNELLAAHRTACLKMDEMGQATLVSVVVCVRCVK